VYATFVILTGFVLSTGLVELCTQQVDILFYKTTSNCTHLFALPTTQYTIIIGKEPLQVVSVLMPVRKQHIKPSTVR